MLDTVAIKDPNPKWWLKSVPKVNNWSDINILRFLRHYQNHPVLWNLRDPQYKNVCARLHAYKHIIELLNLRNVNVDECMKLVEWLKKRYVEEKEIKRPKCERRPAWFEIIKGIVAKILNPKEEEPICGFCKQCCDCKTPSDTTVSSDFQACKDCCTDQNIHPPCEYYKSSDKDEKEDSNRCHFQNVECYKICDDEVQVVLLNIGSAVKKYNSDCDCKTDDSVDRNSDCDCKTEDDDSNSKKSSESCVCCKSESLPSVPNSSCNCLSSSSKSVPSSATIQSVSTTVKFCIQPMPDNSSSSRTLSSSSTTIDEKNAGRGIFMDSQRFRGKRISLVDDYMTDDRGELKLIAPRLHRARCCCDTDYYYPLQVEL